MFNVKYEIVLHTPYSKARWGGAGYPLKGKNPPSSFLRPPNIISVIFHASLRAFMLTIHKGQIRRLGMTTAQIAFTSLPSCQTPLSKWFPFTHSTTLLVSVKLLLPVPNISSPPCSPLSTMARWNQYLKKDLQLYIANCCNIEPIPWRGHLPSKRGLPAR